MLRDCISNLKNPGKNYRGIPFWSWNDKLDKEELEWQIREQDRMGLGGYFMHARGGLKTSYLSEEWMQCIETCIVEGNKSGMGSWIYDENGWPSGFAGGMIPALGDEYRQKYLEFKVVKKSGLNTLDNILGIYKTHGNYEKIENVYEMPEDEDILSVCYKVNPYYTDLLNAGTVEKFIESTHEVYYKAFTEHYGKGLPGIFTDEPQYGREAIPWSFIVPERFKVKYGYDLLDHLSALYYKTPDYKSVRYDFWNLLTGLFTEGYAKQISEWCESHNCRLTGHVLLEEDIRYQTMCSGSAMGFYQYMHIPGIDWLGRDIGNAVICKQVSSVANQLGKEQVIGEMFACSGWNSSFEDLKRIAEWQYVLGVNLMCAHLEGYSIRGMRKRDHPPGMFYQSPWWGEYRKFNDYFARLGMLLTEGSNEADLLVIHPLRSGWILFDESCYNRIPNTEIQALDSKFADLSGILSGLHYNYHYGDEEIMAKFGKVEDGKLKVGKCAYTAVIIPPSITLDPKTIELLKDFISSGGSAFCFEEFPGLCMGRNCSELAFIRRDCIEMGLSMESIEKSLDKSVKRPVRVLSAGKEVTGILHQIRNYDDGYGVFLVNTGKQTEYETEIRLNRDKPVFIVNLEEGVPECIPYKKEDGVIKIALRFAPAQSYMILASDSVQAGPFDRVENYSGKREIKLESHWTYELKNLNVLTMDYCRLKIGNGEWSEKKPVILLQKELLELGRNEDITLEFTFESDFGFENGRESYLVVEDAKKYDIEINGRILNTKAAGWWKDKSFKKISVKGMVRKGTNKIVLKTHFYNSPEILNKLKRAKEFEAEANMLTFDSELESIYLLGDFVVRCEGEMFPAGNDSLMYAGNFFLSGHSNRLFSGDFTGGGFPFYSGSVLLYNTIDIGDIENYASIVFKMTKPHAAVSRLYINGTEVKTFMWGPFEAEVRKYLKNGVNAIAVELVGTDRNLFGPHHHPNGELLGLGPLHFTDKFGWLDSYCFVKFGLEEFPRLIFRSCQGLYESQK